MSQLLRSQSGRWGTLFVVLGVALVAAAVAISSKATAPTGLPALGIIGDGKTDDTEAIQAAINSGSGTLTFPRGTYRLTKSVVIELDKTGFTSLIGNGTANFIMEGSGPAFKFVGTHQANAAPKNVKEPVWARQRAPLVDGLVIVGANAEADGIEASGTMQLTITRVVVREARHGIHLTTRDRNIVISDCHLYHNRGVGIYYDQVDLHQSNIVGCHISYNAGGGVVSRGGNVRNVQISGCDIESNMEPDAPPTANVMLDCATGSIGEVAITGCTLQHNGDSPGSANIAFIGQKKIATDEENSRISWGLLTISGNVLTDVRNNIDLRYARGVVIQGNTFGPAFEQDIVIEGSSNVVIGSNCLDRNPQYVAETVKCNGGLRLLHCRDCTISGVHLNGALRQPAAVAIEDCENVNLSNCTILDSDGTGILVKNSVECSVSSCVVRDRRPDRRPAPSLLETGGRDNQFQNNIVSHGQELARPKAAPATR